MQFYIKSSFAKARAAPGSGIRSGFAAYRSYK